MYICMYVYIYTYISIYVAIHLCACIYRSPRLAPRLDPADSWPLQDIVITNIVWCVAYKGRVGGRICMA